MDVSGFKTLNSIIIFSPTARVPAGIRLNTRRKNVNAIVITLGRFASKMTHIISSPEYNGNYLARVSNVRSVSVRMLFHTLLRAE